MLFRLEISARLILTISGRIVLAFDFSAATRFLYSLTLDFLSLGKYSCDPRESELYCAMFLVVIDWLLMLEKFLVYDMFEMVLSLEVFAFKIDIVL